MIETTKEKIEIFLNKAYKISDKNLSLPVLGCVLFEVRDKNLIIRSTNLDLGVEFVVPAKIKNDEFKAAIPSEVIYQYITSLPKDEPLTLFIENNNLKITTKSTETVIKTQDSDDFPSIPEIKKGKKISLNINDFINGLKSVYFSAYTSNIKPELASVYIYTKDDHIYFVATDSFRLAEKRIKKTSGDDVDSVLIPQKNIPEIIRMVDQGVNNSNIELDFIIDNNQLAVSWSDGYLTSRLIDGNFPDYKQIIPKDFITEVVVLKEDFLSALKVSNVFTDDFKQVSFSVSVKDKKFQLKTKNPHIGESVISLSGAIEGGDMEVSFNYKYIFDVFQLISSDSVSLQFAGENSPLVIKGVSDNSFLYLVMPMNR